MNPICKRIYKLIKKSDEIIIARHIGVDPDAIASQLALRDSIRLTFPNKKVYAVGLSVAKYRYFGALDKINEDELNNPLLIILDLPHLTRVDGINPEKYKKIIKIDHHPFEQKMGLDWLDESSCSTSQMIAELLFNTKLKYNDKIIENIFLGIVSDSERFLLTNTTSKTFLIIAKLMETTKLDLRELYGNLYQRPLTELRFQGFLATNLIVNDSGFAYMKITSEDLKLYNVDVSSASNMINSFNYVKEILVWSFVTYDEKNNIFKVSIRSNGPIINEIANKYNGGGHKLAAGCRVLNEVEVDNLLNELNQACETYQTHENK